MYKVLIVDDDMPVRRRLRQFQHWECNGFVIADEACNGKEALKKLFSQCFDLVITDIRMPGMNGLELISRVKAKNLDIGLILLSTYTDFEYAQQGIRLGVFDYMIKPVEDDVLNKALERVKSCLDRKRLQKSSMVVEKLNLYYTKKQERKLIEFILLGSNTALDEASCICAELVMLTEGDFSRTSLLLEKILKNLSEEIYRGFPWLKALEKRAFDGTVANTESIEKIQENFLKYINNMLEIIKKYELHHLDRVVKQTCQYVIEHVEEDITLHKIAKEVYISSSYIGKLFKQKTGSSFNDYVTKIKMEHAKYLLVTGKYKSYEVSEKLKYSSSDYFCRLFKSYTGHTPYEFKKIVKSI